MSPWSLDVCLALWKFLLGETLIRLECTPSIRFEHVKISKALVCCLDPFRGRQARSNATAAVMHVMEAQHSNVACQMQVRDTCRGLE